MYASGYLQGTWFWFPHDLGIVDHQWLERCEQFLEKLKEVGASHGSVPLDQHLEGFQKPIL
jgi:hypothetical protein